jgi:hypothetical protein
MFKDIELSVDIMAAFRQSCQFRNKMVSGVDMSVSVLTSGFWPSYPVTEAKLPQVTEFVPREWALLRILKAVRSIDIDITTMAMMMGKVAVSSVVCVCACACVIGLHCSIA